MSTKVSYATVKNLNKICILHDFDTTGGDKCVLVEFVPTAQPSEAGGRLNKKDELSRYGDSHVKDKTS